jgi:electron transfer flavoprotein-quinone oxidoreductase
MERFMGVANYDVVIIGAGAAGLSAAIGLAKQDFSVLVLEAGAYAGAENWSGCVYFAESLANPELLGPDGVEALAWERRLVERGIFSGNGHSFSGATYRNADTFRHCYTVLRPIFDHHLSQVARQAGATLLTDTTAEGLIRERGRVIGVSTNRGPLYADLVFLAEGDASHLVTKEGYEKAAPGRQDAHFLQGVKQVIEMPDGAIEEIFGVGAEEGVAYEMLLRNGVYHGREATLNMGGFMYTNRSSISLGFVLPLHHLHDRFGGDPNVLMEWLRGLPQIRNWTRGGRPGVFGAKLIRGGGLRDVPRLVDHGLAIGGAASAIGVDFPYPNFTGPATGMGLLIARAAVAIRREGGSFTRDELDRHYLRPLESSHWYDDVRHLRRWPGYVEKTRYFFTRSIDVLQGSLYVWTRPEMGWFRKWREWTRLVRRTLPSGAWGEMMSDSRQMVQALGLNEAAGYHPVWRVLLDSLINSARDLVGRERPHLGAKGELKWHFSVLGGKEPVGPLPHAVADWGRRIEPVLRSVAHEIYRNEPTPLREKLGTIMERLVEQVNLLDVLAISAIGACFGVTSFAQWIAEQFRRLARRAAPESIFERWQAATSMAGDYSRAPMAMPQASNRTDDLDRWEDKLGRLSYYSSKEPHIKLFWPRDLTRRGAVADAGVWHVCPANVYECHGTESGQLRLVVNHENCIKCESCWRATDLVDWGRNGGHQLIYRVGSPATGRLLEAQEAALDQRPRPPKTRDWWSTAINRIAQRTAASGGNGHFSGALGRLESLCGTIEVKLIEFGRVVSAEPRTMDNGRVRWIETLATYTKQLVEELADLVREGPLSQIKDQGLRDVQAALLEATNSLRAKTADLTRRTYDRQLYWAATDARQIRGHQLEGLRRIVRLLRGHFAPAPLEPPAYTRWLQAERALDSFAAQREEFGHAFDAAFDRLAWRAIDSGTPLSESQSALIRSLCSGIKATGQTPGADRKVILSELANRIPSLAYALASHLWARDIVRIFGGAAFEDVAAHLATGSEMAAFAWEGTVEVDRDDEGIRLRGQKLFVPTALARWFVVLADDQLVVLSRDTPGLRVEPLGTIGMRGAAPATLVLDNVTLPATHRRVDKKQFDRFWAVQSGVDLAAIACGMARRLETRAIEHATSRVQFPGLFLDDEFRESIGKFGAVKKLLAQIGAQRYALETLVFQFSSVDLSDDTYRRALELKIVAGECMNGHSPSVPYNTTQIFGGTGYSEEDFLPMFYRDGSTLLALGVPNASATGLLGQMLMRRKTELGRQASGGAAASGLLVGLGEAALFDATSQRKAMQRELDALRRVRHEVESAVARWQTAAASDPQEQTLAEVVAHGVARRQTDLVTTEFLLLRTHARLESGLAAELEVELVRTWLQDVVDAAHAWVDWLADSESHLPLTAIQPPALCSKIQTSYQAILDRPSPYQTGDYLVKAFDPAAPRYVPELVPFDPDLGPFDKELNDLLRANYRDRLFKGRTYERHVEAQHELDPQDFELFRKHGFLKMYVPTEFGGLGVSKARYNLLVKNLIRNGDVGQTLTVQANSSIGTVPVLLGLFKELPRARKDLGDYRNQERERAELRMSLQRLTKLTPLGTVGAIESRFERFEKQVHKLIGSRAVLRVVYQTFLEAVANAARAVRDYDIRSFLEHIGSAQIAFEVGYREVEEFAGELDRRVDGLSHFFRWIATGQMTAFALTEPSAGSDTARVATRAVMKSVELRRESDGSYRFTPASGGGEKRLIDSRRLEFRPEGAFYRWSDDQEPSVIRFDDYDYESDDSERPRYYMAGAVKVPFHDIAQIRSRAVANQAGTEAPERLFYDYWELNGAKMWLTNARMCGVMVLYAKTRFGVTSFYVDRHAEGLLVGKNEEKMGQRASVTNELGLQAVRVPRENVNGLEGRGQVNALEALNAGRSGLTTSSTTSMEDLIVRAERFTLDRHGALTPLMRHRLEEMAEIRFACEAIACELVVRADHRGTQSFRVEPSIGKMMSSELLMRVIQLCEDIYELEGQTTLHNLEKHKRDHRIITVYEGTNEIQRTVILKDLIREIVPRINSPESAAEAPGAGSDKLRAQRAVLEEMKRSLHGVLRDTASTFGDEALANPNMQMVFFGLSDAAAYIKLADAVLGRAEWVLANLDAALDAAYREWCVRIARRAIARMRRQFAQGIAHVVDCMSALRQGAYPPQERAASLMMSHAAAPAVAPATKRETRPHEISRAIQIVVVLEMEPTVSPQPAVSNGRWSESHFRLDPADASAIAAARAIGQGATAPVRVVVVGAGPRRAAIVMEQALASGADEAIHVLTDGGALAPEPVSRAIARAVESAYRAPDLVLTRTCMPAATGGLIGMLVARELGLQFIPSAQSFAVRFTENEASAIAWSGDRAKPQRVSLPAAIGIVADAEPPLYRIADFLGSIERPIKFVPWPEEITRRTVRLVPVASAADASAIAEGPSQLTPDDAADLLLKRLGLSGDAQDAASEFSARSPSQTTDKLAVQAGAVLVIAGTDKNGRLRAADRRAVRIASGIACQRGRPLAALVFAPADEDAQSRAAGELASLGASSITMAITNEFPEPRVAGDLWTRVLIDRWSPEWSGFGVVVASRWIEPALGRFGSRQAELVFGVTELATGQSALSIRTSRVEGKVDALRDFPANDAKPIWLTVTENAESGLTPLDEVPEPRVVRWPIEIAQLPSRRELMDLLSRVRDVAGVTRLNDAEFIVDVGFGIGSGDGYEEIILPLEQLLRQIGVPQLTIGASRKVTEELRVVPSSQQIGQTGQSVNPVILLAIGISGAPQHLNYIGQRATILAFNRDPEAPIMTLNQRQPRPRVFPIVGDLFQTVPAFMAALREHVNVESPSDDCQPALAK